MKIERALEPLRLRLLRYVAGLLLAVRFVSVGPFSNALSRWVIEYVSSVLSRTEAAAQYLVIAQARLIADRTGSDVDQERLFDFPVSIAPAPQDASSLSSLRHRLDALRVMLENLPRYGLRLLRQTEKRVRRVSSVSESFTAPQFDMLDFEMLGAWRFVGARIDRPPDKGIFDV